MTTPTVEHGQEIETLESLQGLALVGTDSEVADGYRALVTSRFHDSVLEYVLSLALFDRNSSLAAARQLRRECRASCVLLTMQ